MVKGGQGVEGSGRSWKEDRGRRDRDIAGVRTGVGGRTGVEGGQGVDGS